MATATELFHDSHEHPLIPIDDFDSSSIAAPLVCCICDTPIIGLSPAYTCSLEISPCSFFLHKRCAESPPTIEHLHHPQHLLHLKFIESRRFYQFTKWAIDIVYFSCAACTREINNMWVYKCSFCDSNWLENINETESYYPFALCARCVVMESVVDHKGHKQHSLTLLRRKACLSCDACGTEAEEFHSYICHTCHFWIHGSCAAYPHTIKLRIHEDDTLQLIYSIPDMYRRFIRHCPICTQVLNTNNWAYHCEESGYFLHINCAAALLASGKNMITIEDDDEQTYSDLMQLPLPSTDSLTENLIAVHRSGNLTHSNTIQDKFDNGEESPVIDHWSHPEHKLFLLEQLQKADNSDDESDTNNHIDEMLVCNGCVQPISTTSNKHYYGCIGCNFFLHTTCANHLPLQFHPGKCDPQHTLELVKYPARPFEYTFKLYKYSENPFQRTDCYSCRALTNGFTYICNTCHGLPFFCILCCLTPHRIKHEYHMHPLVQRRSTSGKTCNACLETIHSFFEYGCGTCSDIQIHQSCAMSFPKIITQRWDSHSISLTYPPVYYKGLRYCEKCELEVNPEAWLYRCSECDQCFHPLCIRQPHNMKLGKMVASSTRNLHPHTLTLKMIYKNRYPERLHKFVYCREELCLMQLFSEQLCLECAGCNYLICVDCSLPKLEEENV